MRASGAGRAVGEPYITATHDRNNPRSGGVMRRLGMRCCDFYEEQWRPKNLPVAFRLCQRNPDGNDARIYEPYRARPAALWSRGTEPPGGIYF